MKTKTRTPKNNAPETALPSWEPPLTESSPAPSCLVNRDWVVDRLIRFKSVSVITGSNPLGVLFFALDLAYSVAKGIPFLGCRIDSELLWDVLFITDEAAIPFTRECLNMLTRSRNYPRPTLDNKVIIRPDDQCPDECSDDCSDECTGPFGLPWGDAPVGLIIYAVDPLTRRERTGSDHEVVLRHRKLRNLAANLEVPVVFIESFAKPFEADFGFDAPQLYDTEFLIEPTPNGDSFSCRARIHTREFVESSISMEFSPGSDLKAGQLEGDGHQSAQAGGKPGRA